MTATDPADAPPAEASSADVPPAPVMRRRSRVREIWILLVCLGLAIIAVVVGETGGSSPRRAPVAAPSSSVAGASAADGARHQALAAVLARRSAAILNRNRAEFAATLDPRSRKFRRQQLRMFANLSKVSFSHWSYDVALTTTPAEQRRLRKYGVPAFAPTACIERYAIAGFDRQPTNVSEYPTFVERRGQWYLASLSDERAIGDVSQTQIWDYGPMTVVQRPHVLVLGPPDQAGTLRTVAETVRASIPKVTAVWGADWSHRAVVQLPSSVHEMAAITDDEGDLKRIAALTSAETDTTASGLTRVGDRITLNPTVWPELGPIGVEAILTHELTHIASRSYTGRQTPKWLSEGLADYVGYLSVNLPASEIAAELTGKVNAGKAPRTLPSRRDFDGANPDIAVAYQEGWMACRYLATRYGQHRLVRFYRAVGSSPQDSPRSVRDALRSTFHLTPGQFISRWRNYVRRQL